MPLPLFRMYILKKRDVLFLLLCQILGFVGYNKHNTSIQIDKYDNFIILNSTKTIHDGLSTLKKRKEMLKL